jgi:transposase
MAAKPGAPRRKHSTELKAAVVEECGRPGASVAAIALTRGLNANLVHQWLRSASSKPQTALIDKPRFVEMKLPTLVGAPPAPVARDIRIELRRGATSISVAWPTEAAAQCAAWLGELLR